MADNSKHGSDTGAAYVCLIGGALFIVAILYAIVLWTNSRFEGHKAETASAPAAVASVV